VLNPNVLIEIGAALALYGKRFILLVEEGTDLPSNLQGLYQARYSGGKLDYDAFTMRTYVHSQDDALEIAAATLRRVTPSSQRVGQNEWRHGIASAHLICPSKPSVVAVSR